KTFSIEGKFSLRMTKLSSPVKLIIFRLINLVIGRFSPNLIRFLIQKLLITGKWRQPYRFRRVIQFHENDIRIEDTFLDPMPIKRVSRGVDATSMYVANSNVYQESVIRLPWQHGDDAIVRAVRSGGARWERVIEIHEAS